MNRIRSVPCPRCRAEAGEACRRMDAKSGTVVLGHYTAFYHPERVKASGVPQAQGIR